MDGVELAKQVAEELRRIEDEERQAVEREWQGRCVKPEERVEGE